MSGHADDERAIFLSALEHAPGEQREAYLRAACGDRAEVLRRVRKLLSAHDQSAGPLDAPPPGLEPAPTTGHSPAERPGTQIGPYKLLQQIGEGGMGVVYMAEQTEPVKRRVALKIIKPGMDTRQVIARFEAERQALSLMDHPNIAKVLDAGTTENGRPYFVMELVNGAPITKYCDDNRLTPRQRLELFVPVCQAIQHAHQKGIIHRDIKPTNVMVTLYDGQPVPKVIDFGVAKATEQKLTEQTLFTQHGTLVGTLEYMSPEQAEMSALGVDTRSDIFSLGVLLYELLTGGTPLGDKRIKEAAYAEILRMIKEEEPPKPSTRLSDSGEGLASISANRHMEPAKLTKLVRGELDWIVMKALEKDRNRRYETANGFATDVQRYLDDEPVQACPPSATYRFHKFARRNRRTLVTTALLALALLLTVGAVAGSVGWAARDRAARQGAVELEASRALDEAERSMEQEKWSEALAAVQRGEGVLAGSGGDKVRDRVQKLRGDLELMLRLDDVRLLATDLDNNWHEWDRVDQGYALAFADSGIDVLSLPVEETASRVRARDRLAKSLALTLDIWAYTPSPKTMTNRERIRAVAGAVDSDPWRRQVRAAVQKTDRSALVELADSPNLAQQPRNSLVVLQHSLTHSGLPEKALNVLRVLQRQNPGDFWANYWLASDLFWSPRPNYSEVVSFARVAVAVRPNSAAARLLLALALQRNGTLHEAVEYHHKAIELAPNNAYAHHDLGGTLHLQGKYDEAVVCFRKAIELWPENFHAYGFLGHTLNAQKKPDEAIAAFRKATELNPNATHAHIALGKALLGQKKVDEAVVNFQNVSKLSPQNSQVHVDLGNALRNAGKLDEAIVFYNKAIELDPINASAHHDLGRAVHLQGKYDEAIVCFRKAIELWPENFHAYYFLGHTLNAQKKPDEAIAAFRKAIKHNPDATHAHIALGNALGAHQQLDEAIVVFSKAIELKPDNWEAWYGRAWFNFNRQQWDDAIGDFSKATELAPKVHTNWFHRGYSYLHLAQWDNAAADFTKVIDGWPDEWGGWYLRTLAFAQLNQPDKALADLRQAIAKGFHDVERMKNDPKLEPLRTREDFGKLLEELERKEALIAQQKLDDAIAGYRKTIDLDPNDALAQYGLGSLLYKHQKFAQAEAAYREAGRLNPEDGEARRFLGHSLFYQKKWAEAEAIYQEAIQLKPDDAGLRSNLGKVLFQQNKLTDAETEWRESIRLKPDHLPAHVGLNNLAWLLATSPDLKARNPKRAIELAKIAVEHAPNVAWNTLGVAHYRTGDWQAAVTALQKSMELPKGGDSFDWYFLAMAHCRQGREDEARKWYDQAVAWMDKNRPDDEELHRFRTEAEELMNIERNKD